MTNNNLDNRISELTEFELRTLSGGQPDQDTGFWYDVAYVLFAGIIINPRPTGWATSVSPY
jgi:hypothetical protein